MQRYSTLKTRTPLRAKKPWNPIRKPLAVRTGLKTKTALKAHKPMRKVGKVGRANSAARKAIANIAEELQMKECEIGFEGCLKTWPLAPAHRHKRAWYKGDAKLLSDPKQWLCACQYCHDKIEHDPDLTEQTFLKIRGPEN